MDRLDDELTRVLREPENPYNVEEVLAGVYAGRKRRRIFLVGGGLAAAAAVVALILTNVVLGQHTDTMPSVTDPAPSVGPGEYLTPSPSLAPTPGVDLTGAVPWSDRTDAEKWTAIADVTTSCRAEDLKALPSNAEGATQHFAWFLRYRYKGESACLLAGYPKVEIRASGGSWERVEVRQETFFPGGDTDVALGTDAGGNAEVNLEFPVADSPCSPVSSGFELRLILADGSQLPVAIPKGDVRRCLPSAVARWNIGYAAEPPDRFPDLRASIEAPASVAPGSVLEYVVTLTNTGDITVPWGSCPGYEQGLRTEVRHKPAPNYDTAGAWRLACDRYPSLAAGESVRFAMRLQVPAGIGGDAEVLLSWRLSDNQPDLGAQTWLSVESR